MHHRLLKLAAVFFGMLGSCNESKSPPSPNTAGEPAAAGDLYGDSGSGTVKGMGGDGAHAADATGGGALPAEGGAAPSVNRGMGAGAEPQSDSSGASGGGDEGGHNEGGAGTTSERGFTVTTPAIEVGPAEESAVCYYFRTSNDEDVSISRWDSTFTAGISYVSLVLTDGELAPPGTFSSVDCAVVMPGRSLDTWVYSAWTPQAGWMFPADDQGNKLGKTVSAKQSAYLMLHLTNSGSSSIQAFAELKATAHPAGVSVTRAEPYVAYNTSLSIPAHAEQTAEQTCLVPIGTKLSWMSMFSRKQSVRTYIKDGTTVFFENSSWENPGSRTSITSFSTQQVTYGCQYLNVTARTIFSGPSPSTDETCMMLSYHFPAAKPRFCVNSLLLQ